MNNGTTPSATKVFLLLEKAFHAFVIGIMFMLMASLLKAQIPPKPPKLIAEMEYFSSFLQTSALAFGVAATFLALLGLLSLWSPIAQLACVLKNNSTKLSLAFNAISLAVVIYFIGWFWFIPC